MSKRPKPKQKAKKTFIAQVIIKSKHPEKLPDFGLGKGVILAQEITFTDEDGRGFNTPIFMVSRLDHAERLKDEAVEVKFVEK